MTYSLDLPEELNKYVQAKLTAGEYTSVEEMFVAILRDARAREQLRKDLEEAQCEVERGEDFDGDEVFSEILGKPKLPRERPS
jgi:Arc/MetJ-type ribon-helix-helix transcriptional regulator